MDHEWDPGRFSDSIDAEHMIKVGVGRDDTGWRCVDIFDEPQDSFRLIAGIDDHCLGLGLNDVAVSLQASNDQSVYLVHFRARFVLLWRI